MKLNYYVHAFASLFGILLISTSLIEMALLWNQPVYHAWSAVALVGSSWWTYRMMEHAEAVRPALLSDLERLKELHRRQYEAWKDAQDRQQGVHDCR